jgi:hypothetical protein
VKARKHLEVGDVSLTSAKVVGQVNDVGWQRSMVLLKPAAKPVSATDKTNKLREKSEGLWSRASFECQSLKGF